MKKWFPFMSGCCIATASFLLTTDMITAIAVALLIGAGIAFLIHS